jgi:hypothetical protein
MVLGAGVVPGWVAYRVALSHRTPQYGCFTGPDKTPGIAEFQATFGGIVRPSWEVLVDVRSKYS